MIGIFSHDAGEHLDGFLDTSLLEAEGAEGVRRERVVDQDPGQARGLAGTRKTTP